MSWSKTDMANYVASLISDNSTLNLGIGMPSMIAQYINESQNIMIHSENGVLGVKSRPQTSQEASPTLINAAKETISIKKGASFFDSATSFGMVRGGHIDYCILGAMEVDSHGSLANWMIPGKKVTGMGGAMDLVNGAGQVIIMMNHFTKNNSPKLVRKTNLPLTGLGVVDQVITDLGHFKPQNGSFEIIKLAPGVSANECKLP